METNQNKIRFKYPVIVFSAIALLLIGLHAYYRGVEAVGEYLDLFVVSSILLIVSSILLIIYAVMYKNENKARIILPVVCGVLAVQHLWDLIISLKSFYSAYSADLHISGKTFLISALKYYVPLYLVPAALFTAAAITSACGKRRKVLIIITSVLMLIEYGIYLCGSLIVISQFDRERALLTLVFSLGYVSFFTALLLASIKKKNKTKPAPAPVYSAPVRPSPEYVYPASAPGGMNTLNPEERALMFLENRYKEGFISKEEYDERRANIISKH